MWGNKGIQGEIKGRPLEGDREMWREWGEMR